MTVELVLAEEGAADKQANVRYSPADSIQSVPSGWYISWRVCSDEPTTTWVSCADAEGIYVVVPVEFMFAREVIAGK